MIKKIIAVIMALVLALSLGMAAFAADAGEKKEEPAAEQYDYNQDPLVTATASTVTDYANGDLIHALKDVVDKDGIPVTDKDGNVKQEIEKDEKGEPKVYLGTKTYAMYQVTAKKMFALNDVPSYTFTQELKNSDGTPIIDETTGEPRTEEITYKVKEGGDGDSVKYEGIPVYAYYAVKCPKCKMATGGYTYYEIYSANAGCCPHCGFTFPSPSDESMVFYRFIVVSRMSTDNPTSESKYYDKFKEYDFTKYSGDVFGDSAQYYGEGKDLPQQFLTYENVYDETIYDEGKQDFGATVETLTGFQTSGKAKNSTTSTLYGMLSSIELWLEPITQFLSNSLFVQMRTNIKEGWYKIIDAILTAPFT